MAAPTIASVTPALGTSLGGTVVTIVGTGFTAPAPVVVRVAGSVVAPTTATATQIVLTTPAHAAGVVAVSVQNADGTVTALYTYVLVPTLTAVTPNAGLTRGTNLVQLTGTGFRLPPAPPATGYLGGDAVSTVKVSFEGVVSAWAHAITSSRAFARVPTWSGAYDALPAALDVRIANLDDAGVEIPLQNVTRVNAYTIARPELAQETTLQRVIRELIKVLRRHVVPNVGLTLGRDYQEDLTDFDRIRATTPCVALYGPHLAVNRFYSLNAEEPETEPLEADAWVLRKEPVTVDLDFEMRGWATGEVHAYGLAQALILCFRDLVRLDVGGLLYEVEIPWDAQPDFGSVPNFNDLHTFGARLLIRGVHLDDDPGTVILRGWDITANGGDPVMDVQVVAP